MPKVPSVGDHRVSFREYLRKAIWPLPSCWAVWRNDRLAGVGKDCIMQKSACLGPSTSHSFNKCWWSCTVQLISGTLTAFKSRRLFAQQHPRGAVLKRFPHDNITEEIPVRGMSGCKTDIPLNEKENHPLKSIPSSQVPAGPWVAGSQAGLRAGWLSSCTSPTGSMPLSLAAGREPTKQSRVSLTALC